MTSATSPDPRHIDCDPRQPERLDVLKARWAGERFRAEAPAPRPLVVVDMTARF